MVGVALACAYQGPALGQNKIGFVNTERILREAAFAVRAQKKLETEFAKRDQELAKLAEQVKRMQADMEKNAMTMTETQRRNKEREFGELNRDWQRKQRDFREEFNQRRNEELGQVVAEANTVIRRIAEQDKYDIIFQDAVYANPRIDITKRVIDALDAKPAEGKPAAR
ncbi:MAG: OmpH family outer membrane protein [Betaproteobacteria bacterium]|nr:OmpH family outer membrane protein [Betaproteobacteria bacterium]